jgi:hypothetical protein
MELCPAHQLAAVGSCTRCGRFVCEQCRRWMSEKPFCTDCLRRLGNKPSRDAVIALLLGTIGLVTFVPGIAAIVLAQRELKRIKAGEAPESGRDFATLARGLGIFELLVGGGVLMVKAFTSLG